MSYYDEVFTKKQSDISLMDAERKAGGQQLRVWVPAAMAGERLDKALAQLFPDYSRGQLQQWIRAGQVRVDARGWRSRDRLQGEELVELTAVLPAPSPERGEAIPLQIIYEDEALLVIDKPAGLVVHPGAGNRQGTMMNALLHYAPELGALPRAGIIHRLDKDTSGLLVVARSSGARRQLIEQLTARSFTREYQAIVNGVMTAGGSVDAAIGRHRVQRTRMAVTVGGREAVSHYRVMTRFRAHTHIKVSLDTGRTHQIRVHMAHIHFPLVGDPLYGGRLRLPRGCSAALQTGLRAFRRQALHAARLGISHPLSGERLHWESPLPEDMTGLLAALAEDLQYVEQAGAY